MGSRFGLGLTRSKIKNLGLCPRVDRPLGGEAGIPLVSPLTARNE